jgi:hypothetical protein
MTRPQMSAQLQEAAALPIAAFCHSMDGAQAATVTEPLLEILCGSVSYLRCEGG